MLSALACRGLAAATRSGAVLGAASRAAAVRIAAVQSMPTDPSSTAAAAAKETDGGAPAAAETGALAVHESKVPGVVKEPLTNLSRHLIDTIKATLTHPLGGYYMKGDVFGTEGDFITSPEISQMFGEASWPGPTEFQLVELGPGRGTLMHDMLRTLAQLKGVCERIVGVHMVEASPELRAKQAARLAPGVEIVDDSVTTAEGIRVTWHDSLESVPHKYTFLMAHEFFDAMPVYKFEATTKASVSLLKGSLDRLSHVQIGERVEIAPDVDLFSSQIASRIQADGGAALLIDYGRNHVVDDSLRGIRQHQFVHPLTSPGECDLSADVDFSAIAHAGLFLERMGIGARVVALLKVAGSTKERKAIVAEFERLVDPNAMGEAYKIQAITGDGETPYGLEPMEADARGAGGGATEAQ
nr:NADH dehydrogenase [ubiquinone] complex I, assembly factor 7 [Polyrhizophydium stewartii]